MTSVMNILFLGTGTSTGVPQIGCSCAVCTSPDPRNKRLRSSIYVEASGTRILLDSSPDLRQQALRENITDLDAVLYTHAHVDHIGGFDDLRAFCWRRTGGLPMYASPETMKTLRTMYGWAFESGKARTGYVRPEPHEATEPFRVGSVLAHPPSPWTMRPWTLVRTCWSPEACGWYTCLMSRVFRRPPWSA